MRCCACCRMPGRLARIHYGRFDDLAVLFGVCVRCDQTNARLPAGTAQKRLNAAGALAARDTSGRYYTARFADSDAASLAAHLLAAGKTGPETSAALGWE